MKKFLVFLIVLIIVGAIGYFFFFDKLKDAGFKIFKPRFAYEDLLVVSSGEVEVNRFTIYGKHLNLEGTLPTNESEEEKKYTVVLKNDKEEKIIPTIIDGDIFKLSNNINDGINLETMKIGDYVLMLKEINTNSYYTLINKTEYHDNVYYTITKNKKNNKITFPELTFDKFNYWTINIVDTVLPDDVYDVVIDPGHGGVDTGASNGSYHESRFTLDYGKTLAEALREEGLKVKLTREEDVKIDHYGEGSRTGIPYEVKAKLMLSVHLNSSNSSKQKGVEIYTAYNDNYDFAKSIAKNIVDEVGTVYSNNPIHKIMDGVYMRVYSASDREGLKRDGQKGHFEPYVIDENTTYYYFIRETGGIMTKAFSDGRNPQYKANPYRNLNQGVEAYLCEIAYISQKDDLNLVLNKKDDFIRALKKSVLSYLDSPINEEIEEKNVNE